MYNEDSPRIKDTLFTFNLIAINNHMNIKLLSYQFLVLIINFLKEKDSIALIYK